MLGHNKSRLVTNFLRSVSTSCVKCTSHYDVLGVTTKATQNEIKSAYYKLSKVYHPDKSDDETSAKKFRSITEAYEVLGNIKLKKLYDKGLMVGRKDSSRMDYQPEPEPTDPTLKFYKSRTHRQVTPTMDGKVPIYDFDAWSKEHYGDLFKKSQYDKEFIKIKRAKREAIEKATNQEAMMYLMFVVCGLVIMCAVNGTSDYDKDLISTNNEKNKEQKTLAEETNTNS